MVRGKPSGYFQKEQIAGRKLKTLARVCHSVPEKKRFLKKCQEEKIQALKRELKQIKKKRREAEKKKTSNIKEVQPDVKLIQTPTESFEATINPEVESARRVQAKNHLAGLEFVMMKDVLYDETFRLSETERFEHLKKRFAAMVKSHDDQTKNGPFQPDRTKAELMSLIRRLWKAVNEMHVIMPTQEPNAADPDLIDLTDD